MTTAKKEAPSAAATGIGAKANKNHTQDTTPPHENQALMTGETRKGFTQTATITKTAERCKAEGIGLSYHQLWSLCKEGRLKNIPMGRSRLIYWPNLIAFLESGGESGSTERSPALEVVRKEEG